MHSNENRHHWQGGLLLVLVCALFAASAWAGKPACGDGKCSGGETAAICPEDCGAPPPADVCGDGTCGPTEDFQNCPADCPAPPPAACNFDGVCNAGEDCTGCSDCPGKTDGKPKTRYCCGLDTCDLAVCGSACGADAPICGNGLEEYSEECDDGNLDAGDGCDPLCRVEQTASSVPLNQFNIGDSIGEGEAADGTVGEAHHETVWSTGYSGSDPVTSLNERFEATDGAAYTENNAARDPAINQAISGAVMADFAGQAQAVAAQMASIDPAGAGMVSILLGNNDVCAASLADMTTPEQFRAQYRAGLEVLDSPPFGESVNLLISGVPAIYWLWNAKRNDFWCRVFAWPFVPCENLLDNAADDCASSASREDPDNDYVGDGPNCQRRKAFHARIRDEYNLILQEELAEYQARGRLENAEYVDIFDVRFDSQHVNGGDCFHPSTAGHALMAEKQWCGSKWGSDDPACAP